MARDELLNAPYNFLESTIDLITNASDSAYHSFQDTGHDIQESYIHSALSFQRTLVKHTYKSESFHTLRTFSLEGSTLSPWVYAGGRSFGVDTLSSGV